MNEIRNSQNETIIVNWANNGEQYFNLNIPFVPDLVKVQFAICGITNALEHNILSARSNIFNGDVLALANRNNDFNPIYEYYNPQRQNFMGSYSIRLVDEQNNASLPNGAVAVLRFQFTRFKD
jgi:hypothetical protein